MRCDVEPAPIQRGHESRGYLQNSRECPKNDDAPPVDRVEREFMASDHSERGRRQPRRHIGRDHHRVAPRPQPVPERGAPTLIGAFGRCCLGAVRLSAAQELRCPHLESSSNESRHCVWVTSRRLLLYVFVKSDMSMSSGQMVTNNYVPGDVGESSTRDKRCRNLPAPHVG